MAPNDWIALLALVVSIAHLIVEMTKGRVISDPGSPRGVEADAVKALDGVPGGTPPEVEAQVAEGEQRLDGPDPACT